MSAFLADLFAYIGFPPQQPTKHLTLYLFSRVRHEDAQSGSYLPGRRDSEPVMWPRTRVTGRWFIVFICSPLPDISALVSALAPRVLCQEHSLLQRGRWEGGARRDSKIFPLVLRGLLLYIRLCGLLGSHTAPMCFRNSANEQQPGPLAKE